MVVSAYTLLDHPGQQQERLEMVTDLWRMTSDVLVSFFPVVCVCVAWVCVGEHTCICVCTRACVHACLCCYVSVMVCMEDPCLLNLKAHVYIVCTHIMIVQTLLAQMSGSQIYVMPVQVLVENGTSAGFSLINEAREHLLQVKASIICLLPLIFTAIYLRIT